MAAAGAAVREQRGCEPAVSPSERRVREAYEAHAAELRGFARARMRDSSAAEDIVQELFLRLSLETQVRQYPRRPRAWLYRVAINLIVSRHRRAAVANRQADRERFDMAILDSPETSFLATERWRSLNLALDAARPDGRQGLMMAAEGYSGREIALALGRSEAATRTLLCRARKVVRRELANNEPAVA